MGNTVPGNRSVGSTPADRAEGRINNASRGHGARNLHRGTVTAGQPGVRAIPPSRDMLGSARLTGGSGLCRYSDVQRDARAVTANLGGHRRALRTRQTGHRDSRSARPANTERCRAMRSVERLSIGSARVKPSPRQRVPQPLRIPESSLRRRIAPLCEWFFCATTLRSNRHLSRRTSL